jgi:enamine deaminase RidA (YjgF/YER057c/UK114 family)
MPAIRAISIHGEAVENGRKLIFQAVRGKFPLLSGQIGLKPGSMELYSGINRNASNLKTSWPYSENTVRPCPRWLSACILADISEWAMNEVYIEFFPVNPPARSALGTSGLALGARTEIECMAVVAQ